MKKRLGLVTSLTSGIFRIWGAALLFCATGCQDSGPQVMVDMGPTTGMLTSTVGTSPPLANRPLDAAIWPNITDLGKSLVFATERTQTMGSLYSYNLMGTLVQTSAPMNQPGLVDIKTGFVLNGMTVDLAAVAESGTGKIKFFSIDRASGMFTDITGFTAVFKDRSGDAAVPVGVALYRRRSDNAAFIIVSPRSGPMNNYLYQYALSYSAGRIDLPNLPVRQFGDFSTISTPGDNDVKGLLVDDDAGYVYYSDKSFGIRKYVADPDASNPGTQLAVFGKTEFMGDRNGLGVYTKTDGTGYLLSVDQTASQSRILLWHREGQAGDPSIHTLAATLNLNADFTDGIEVTSAPMGQAYIGGLLAVSNRNGGNFLYYAWKDIAATLSIK